MAARIASIRSRLPDLESALHNFTSSNSAFRIIQTINPTKTPPKTLYILDSSFNPPSIAHLTLATSAIRYPNPRDEKPHRLLLLFSTHNADKAPSPASFEQRLAMMVLFAEDLSKSLKQTSISSDDNAAGGTDSANPSDISIDIGLTTAPYYTTKSEAIANTTPSPYPSNPTHIHLLGFDTLTRFLAPKYYTSFDPPLSALSPFFAAGCKLRCTARPNDASDPASRTFGSLDEQRAYVHRLAKGEGEDGYDEDMVKNGWKKEWADAIEIIDAKERGKFGVSSTRIRIAAKERDWGVLKELCTEGVKAWIQEAGLYKEDARGVKMA